MHFLLLTQKSFPADQHLSFLEIAAWEAEIKNRLVRLQALFKKKKQTRCCFGHQL